MVEKVKIISSGEMVREVYKVLESGEKQSIVLRLVPKELGAIKVMLDTVDNVLTAKVEVENETVGSVIRNNVEQLKHNLAQSGVHVNSINISYHNSDQKQNGFNNQKRKNPSFQQKDEIEELDEKLVAKKFGYNTYEFLA
jgi:flagellar hook-length control protein FliK